ncbi:transcriptional regulator with XRE-family HTH domain [Pedobacter sp. AK017]|uniref:helix-turn-helix domain-containing protein n=1 Tax=Pedobacter sp. AK017 TaxID=2723073 RepID=UPI00161145AA|nr:transcriptional regulator with XRE-family HTH domain [Pedobacter sp. AK017]
MNIRNEELILAIGKRIRTIRLQKGLTMEQVSANAGIEYRQVSDVELGKTNPTISTLYAIASALEVKLSALIELDNF